MKIELGGGDRNRGEGFTNVDTNPCADIIHNLETFPYPFDDESVAEVYSSHCLEHLADPHAVLRELCRICTLNAAIEIRVPHYNNPLQFTAGHKHCFSTLQAEDMDQDFAHLTWHGPKRLKLVRYELHPTRFLHQARKELPFLHGVTDQVVMKYIAGTCHETRFFYTVVQNEHYS